MQRGLDGWQTAGVKLTVPVHLVQLAKANMILGELETGLEHLADALTMIDETDERWYQPEVYRLRGTILLALSRLNAPEAENCFHAAIDVARSQNGKWPKLRAATSLARLWGEQGERQKAYDLLAPVYGWFTEGFDTRDLKDARALLDQLA